MTELDETAGAPPQEPVDRLLRTIFHDRYEVREFLGRGAFGTVFRAFDRWVGEDVALKILNHAPSGELLRRFRDEVRLARRITHANVARLHDVGAEGEQHFITMQLIEGKTLREVLAAGAIGRAALLGLLGQVAEGVAAAHAADVVHRDLKPANVMLARDDHAIVMDFGLACAATDESIVRRDSVGTPAYMAPEQFRGEAVSGAADVYALGLMLWEALAGKLPMGADNFWALGYARLHEEPPTLSSAWPRAPRDLARFVDRCLARAASERPTSAELAAILRSQRSVVEEDESPAGTFNLRTAALQRPADRAPMWQTSSMLTVVDGEQAIAYPLDATTTTIGRSAENDLVLDDKSVSNRHARIVRERDGSMLLVDLASTNGTLVNGETVSSARLNHGDVVQLGAVTLRMSMGRRSTGKQAAGQG